MLSSLAVILFEESTAGKPHVDHIKHIEFEAYLGMRSDSRSSSAIIKLLGGVRECILLYWCSANVLSTIEFVRAFLGMENARIFVPFHKVAGDLTCRRESTSRIVSNFCILQIWWWKYTPIASSTKAFWIGKEPAHTVRFVLGNCRPPSLTCASLQKRGMFVEPTSLLEGPHSCGWASQCSQDWNMLFLCCSPVEQLD